MGVLLVVGVDIDVVCELIVKIELVDKLFKLAFVPLIFNKTVT